MATLTVRNVPEEAKHRFRQIAAAHGRSMEEHLRQLVIEADFGDAASGSHVADARASFRPAPSQEATSQEHRVRSLLQRADGTANAAPDSARYADIRFMTAKDAMAELRRLANGVGLDLPPPLNPKIEAPEL